MDVPLPVIAVDTSVWIDWFAGRSTKQVEYLVHCLELGSEDFAYMLEERPGAYILLGNGMTAPVHHPEYDFNDEAIPAGCSWLAGMAEARMPISA